MRDYTHITIRTEEIIKVIEKHGAKAVYDAASAAFGGNTAALNNMIKINGLGDINAIQTIAFDYISDAEKKEDFSQVTNYLSKIGSKGGAAKTAAKKAASAANGALGGRPIAKTSKMWTIVHYGKCGEYILNDSGDTSKDYREAQTWRTESAAESAADRFADSYGIGRDLVGVTRICDWENCND